MYILIAYIILGHPEWKRGQIKIYSIFPLEEKEKEKQKLLELVKSGRLPISKNNINFLTAGKDSDIKKKIIQFSKDTDLTIIGFRDGDIINKNMDLFDGYSDDMGNILFINSYKEKEII